MTGRLLRGARRVDALRDRVQGGARLDLAGAVNATSSAPLNDDFDEALETPGTGFHGFGSLASATLEPGESAGHVGGSVWYVWNPLTGGTARVSVEGSSQPAVHVYRGETLASLQAVDLEDATFSAAADVAYALAITGSPDAGSMFRVDLAHLPENDDRAASKPLAGSQFSTQGATATPRWRILFREQPLATGIGTESGALPWTPRCPLPTL